ncbi:MAG: hypothetical protein DHS20C15_31780 [Planctomycetota bacterium]|nr:MAG: hypothetical protein DHS20C15_31780 [Planctomycetota bacterium]
MLPRSSALHATLLCALLALTPALHAEVELDALLPAQGTVGTELTLSLTGDLGKGKPKLWLTHADDASPKPKKTKLKVSAIELLEEGGAGGGTLTVSFRKTKTGAGLYDLHVKPKGAGQVEQVFEGVFTMRNPVIDAVTPELALAKSEIMITGDFFGMPKKPIVRVTPSEGGKSKKAKVKQVIDADTLLVKLPKLPEGEFDLSVSTKVGTSTLEAAFDTLPPGVSDRFSATFNSSVQSLLLNEYLATGPDQPGVVLAAFHNEFMGEHTTIITTGLDLGGGSEFSLSLGFPFDPGGTATPFTLENGASFSNFNLVVSQESPDADWALEVIGTVSGTLTVSSATKKRIKGSFEFTLVPAGSAPAASDLEITEGEFDLSVVQA